MVIHYHGTPCGGSGVDAAKFLQGRHALISFQAPQDLAIAAEVCQSFCLDSGAYTVWRQGGLLAKMLREGNIGFIKYPEEGPEWHEPRIAKMEKVEGGWAFRVIYPYLD